MLPVSGGKLYVRFYIRLANGMTAKHNTLVRGDLYAAPGTGNNLLFGEDNQMIFESITGDAQAAMSNQNYYNDNKIGPAAPPGVWTCIELLLDHVAPAIDVWVNDVEVPDLHQTAWKIDAYDYLRFGFEKYGGPASDIWYDDIAIGTRSSAATERSALRSQRVLGFSGVPFQEIGQLALQADLFAHPRRPGRAVAFGGIVWGRREILHRVHRLRRTAGRPRHRAIGGGDAAKRIVLLLRGRRRRADPRRVRVHVAGDVIHQRLPARRDLCRRRHFLTTRLLAHDGFPFAEATEGGLNVIRSRRYATQPRSVRWIRAPG